MSYKDKLVFDTTDAGSLAASDKVGAYVYGADGTLITHTNVGGKDGLDVNIINSTLAVTQSGTWTTGRTWTLNESTDSVAAWTFDGTGNAIGSSGGSLNVNVTNTANVSDSALANIAIVATANTLALANTAQVAVAAPLANRKYLSIFNHGNHTIYIGGAGVTSANGFPLSPSAVIELRAGAASPVNWVSDTNTQNIRTLELS